MRARPNSPIARAGLRVMFRSLPSATCLSLRLSKPSACGLSGTSALSHPSADAWEDPLSWLRLDSVSVGAWGGVGGVRGGQSSHMETSLLEH